MGEESPILEREMARVTAESRTLTRERLVRTAAERFAHDGFEGAKVDRISIEAGFAKGTLYNYFPSKEALFAAVIEQAAQRAARLYAGSLPGGTARERLLALAQADVRVLREQEPFTRVLVREAMSFRPETYPLIVRHLAPFLAAVEAALADGARRGEVRRNAPPAQLALLFTGLLSMYYVQHWGSGGAWPALDDVPALVVEAFLDGAAPRPSRPPRRATRARSPRRRPRAGPRGRR
jgi:AcrR family transcriptional regulator